MAKICSHKKFQSNRASSSRDMIKYVEKITKKEREGKSPQNDQKIKENWPLLRNYLSDWTEILCGRRFWPRGAAHQISAFKVEGCRRYWVVRLTCKWCGWAATLCNTLFKWKVRNSWFVSSKSAAEKVWHMGIEHNWGVKMPDFKREVLFKIWILFAGALLCFPVKHQHRHLV